MPNGRRSAIYALLLSGAFVVSAIAGQFHRVGNESGASTGSAGIVVDGGPVGTAPSNPITSVSPSTTVPPSLPIDEFSIVAIADSHGTISPSGKVLVDSGASATFTITPDTGYYIADVHVDTVSVGAVAIYTFTGLSANHTIQASFAIQTFSVVSSAGDHGTITPLGKIVLNYGASQKYAIIPDAGYYIADVHVDTVSVGAVGSYMLTNVTATHTIDASFAINQFSIVAIADSHGTISPSGKVLVDSGSTPSFTITPNTGYYIADVHVDTVSVGPVPKYAFSSVSTNHTIEASFAIQTFSVVSTAGEHGTITPSGKVVLNYGATQKYAITPDAGYHVLDVLVDGSSVGAVTSYMLTNVNATHTIDASFAINQFSIVAIADSHGTISPSGKVLVDSGSTPSFTITPGAGYYIADVHVDTVSVGAVPKYTFSSVSANHTIEASFAIQTFSVVSTAGKHGNITPLGKIVINYGASQKYLITPDTGYHVLDVLVDGSSVVAVTSYILTNVTGTHTIDASFAINKFSIVAIADSHGTISPSGKVLVDSGSTPSFTITPDTGYYIADVHVDTVSVGAVPKYTFTSVSTNHTIEASFAIKTFSILSSAGTHGTITPSGKVVLNYGGTQQYAITPDAGYFIADVHVDSVSVVAVPKYTFTNVSANHTIEASFAINKFSIVAIADSHGTISPSGKVFVDSGSTPRFTITPDTGYYIADVHVDTVSVGAVPKYTFTSVSTNHTIEASFAIKTFSILSSAGTHGTITPSGKVVLNYGATQQYAITPDAGYFIADVHVDSVSVVAVPKYTFTNVSANHTIEASFAINKFSIVAIADSHGTISPSGKVFVDSGSTPRFTITPDTGYYIADVHVDTVSVGAVPKYTFTSVSTNHTIEASFAIKTFSILSSAGTHGTITPSGKVVLNYGGTQQYAITPDAGYFIADVHVDSVSVVAVPKYTFTNVSANHTIEASFAINKFSIVAIADSHGTISPSGKVFVDSGSTPRFTITPDTGYYIADVHVDTVSVGAVPKYTFTSVSTNHTIEASFAIKTFSILSSAGTHGTITPSGKVVLNYGGTQQYAITPDAGYFIADVHVDSVSVVAVPKYTFTNVSANHTIEASFAINKFSIVAIADSHGTISPSGKVFVDSGSTPRFTITPDTGYYIADVHVDTVSVGAVPKYTFTSVSTNHTIEASFAIKTFSILSSAGTHGTITPSGKVVLNYGATQQYAITPDAGYFIADVHVDSVSVVAVPKYTFTNVSANHTIEASFAINKFSIVAIADSHGTISPSGKVFVDSGSTPRFTITPDTGYYIADVHVDTVSVGAVPKYTFTSVSTNHTIEASFAIKTFSILSSAGTHGTITPSGKVVLNYGGTQQYAITPDAGYFIADVHVDSVSVVAVPKYTFTNVSANHTIEASFAINKFSIVAIADSHGTISPSGKVFVDSGSTPRFTITPDTGYYIADVHVDTVSVGAVPKYTFTSVSTNHTIEASFAIKTFSILSSAGTHGTITPSGKVVLNYGGTQQYAITPDAGYFIADVHVDSVSVVAVPKYTFTNVSANHTIEASFAINKFSIVAIADSHGTISPSGKVFVDSGSTPRFTITPDTGYYIADVHVDTVSVGAVPKYTFTSVSTNHTIEASFAIKTFSILSSAGTHGTITPSGKVVLNYGGTQQYVITPDAGYFIADVHVDSVSVVAVPKYTFTNVSANHTIEASFAINKFSIVAIADSHGTISPSGKVFVDSGSTPRFTITPDTGYYIADVHVDTVSVGAVPKYTFTSVSTNHTIEASFAIKTFSILSSAGTHGTITPSGKVVLNYGGTQQYVITPDAGYFIADVHVDSVSVVAVPKYTFTNVSANHTIEASFAINKFSIVAIADSHGTISPSGKVFVDSGSTPRFTITPDTGYYIADVHVDTVSVGAVPKYTFTSVSTNHTIEASFAIKTFSILSSAGTHGTITPSGKVVLNYGGTQQYAITPDAGYFIADVHVDSVSVVAVPKYTFTNVSANHTIEASFAINKFSIVAIADSHGTISPSGKVFVDSGSTPRFTITPDTGYYIADVHVDTVSVGAVPKYTFTSVSTNHTIEASFAIKTFSILSSAGTHGTITPSGKVVLNYGGTQQYAITPDAGYFIADVHVDSVSVVAVPKYTFTNVSANHTIEASFAINKFSIVAIADSHGTISPSGKVFVDSGSTPRFTITPDTGYYIADVHVDTVSVGAVPKYTFTSVSTNHTIEASFAIKTFSILSSAGTHGTITPSGKVVLNYGGTQQYAITPDAGYFIADVHVDSVSVVAVPKYTFTNVSANHTIEASFATHPVPKLGGIAPAAAFRGETVEIVLTGANFVGGVTTLNVGAGISVNTLAVHKPDSLLATITMSSSIAPASRSFTVTN